MEKTTVNDNKMYLKMSLLTQSPLKCEYEDDDLNLSIGEFQYISFPVDYIMANKEAFGSLAHCINSILQDKEGKVT